MPFVSIARIRNPRVRSVSIASPAGISRTIGTWKIDPAEARTVFGL